MSEQLHTPGPWIELPPKIGASITIYAADQQTPIATTCSNASPATMEMHRRGEVKANARLIAAAPDLLAALASLHAMYARAWDCTDGSLHFSPTSVQQFEEIHAKAESALAKAKGQA